MANSERCTGVYANNAEAVRAAETRPITDVVRGLGERGYQVRAHVNGGFYLGKRIPMWNKTVGAMDQVVALSEILSESDQLDRQIQRNTDAATSAKEVVIAK